MSPPELRVYLLVKDLQRQFAAYLGTPTRARGYPPFAGEHSLIVEVAPALAIERVTDLALRAVPTVEPGILYVERQFGVLEVHGASLADVERAGQAILAGLEADPADQLRPRILFADVIEDLTDRQAVIINRNRGGSMVIPGDTLGVCEVTPALFATVAANEAERAAPGVTLVDVSMIGVAGRIYLAGRTADVTRAQQAMADVLAAVEGREQSAGGRSAGAGAARGRAQRGGGRGARGRERHSAGAGKSQRGGGASRAGRLMSAHDLSVGGDVLDRVTRCAARALPEYGCHPGASVRLINVSENATYLIDDPDAGPSVLRVHRLGYHTRAEIASELAWMDALRAEAGVRTPRVLPAPAGDRIVTVVDEASGEQRNCVRFEFLAGTEPSDDSLPHFAELGEITARMHRHARGWQRPAGFTRFHWDYDAAFGAGARWGRWQDGIGVGPAEREILGRLDATLRARLAAFGTGPQRYGLVHADTRLANLLADGDVVSVIDFDDCGFSWYLYDAGTAVSFFEHEPHVPDLVSAWLSGYRRVLDLPDEDEAEIWTFILYRRLLLVAWIGSHTAVDIAQQLGAGYTAGSCDLAEAYLSRLG